MREIASYFKPEEAHLMASVLEGNGIKAFLRDENIVGLHWVPQLTGGVKIQVLDEDVEKAIEILNLPKMEEGIISCPHCGSHNTKILELNALTALSIATGFFLPWASKKVNCLDCRKSFPLKLKKTEPVA